MIMILGKHQNRLIMDVCCFNLALMNELIVHFQQTLLRFEMGISSTRNHCAAMKCVESELAGLIVGCFGFGQICCRIRFKHGS